MGGPDAVRHLRIERVRSVDDALVVVLAIGSTQRGLVVQREVVRPDTPRLRGGVLLVDPEVVAALGLGFDDAVRKPREGGFERDEVPLADHHRHVERLADLAERFGDAVAVAVDGEHVDVVQTFDHPVRRRAGVAHPEIEVVVVDGPAGVGQRAVEPIDNPRAERREVFLRCFVQLPAPLPFGDVREPDISIPRRRECVRVLVNGRPPVLLHNDGGSYERVNAGFETPLAMPTGATSGDFDGDGTLDVFVYQYGSWSSTLPEGMGTYDAALDADNGNPNRLYLGTGSSFERTNATAMGGTCWSLAASAADLTGNGRPGIHVANSGTS